MTVFVCALVVTAVLAAVVCAFLLIQADGYGRGYEAGREDERRSDLHKLNRVFDQAVAQGLAARRELDWLYEQARRRIDELSRW
jgi:hypothetical protein